MKTFHGCAPSPTKKPVSRPVSPSSRWLVRAMRIERVMARNYGAEPSATSRSRRTRPSGFLWQSRRVDLELLRTVVAIHRTGTLTAAAAALGRSQPTVTAQLRSLERQLGQQLFERAP